MTYLCPIHPQYGLHPAMFSSNDSLPVFLVSEYYQVLTATICLPHGDGRLSWLRDIINNSELRHEAHTATIGLIVVVVIVVVVVVVVVVVAAEWCSEDGGCC